jgi:hypothetical protein
MEPLSSSPALSSQAVSFLDSLTLNLHALSTSVNTLSTPIGTFPNKLGVPGGDIPLLSAPKEELRPPSGSSLVALVYVCRPAGVELCGGRIGVDKVKFCSCSVEHGSTICGKVSHTKKADLFYPAFYIAVPSQQHAYLQPSLIEPPGGFSKAILTSLNGTRSVSEWVELFTALRGIEHYSDSEQVDIMARFDTTEYQTNIAPTPMKIRPGKRAAEDVYKTTSDDGSGEEGSGERGSSTGSWNLTSQEVPRMLEDATALEGSILHIVSNWDGMVRASQRQRQTCEDLETDVKVLFEDVDNKVVKVAASVGDRDPKTAPAITLWSSISAHSEALDSHVRMWTTGRAQLEDGVKLVSKDMDQMKYAVGNQLVPMVEKLAANVGELRGVTTSNQNNGSTTHAATQVSELQQEVARMYQQMSSMAAEILKLKEAAVNQSPVSADNIFGNNSSSNRTHEESTLRIEYGLLRDEVRLMQQDMEQMRSENNSEIIEFGGFTFQAADSYLRWVMQHLTSGYYGFCYDFISLLECHSSQNRMSSIGIKSKESVMKAGYTDNKVAIIDQSFGCTFPELFGDELDSSNPSKKMGSLKSATDWDNPSGHAGLKYRIDTFLTAYKKAVEGQIGSTLLWNTTAGLFFTQLMQHNIKFWDHMSAWITRFERELTHRAGGDDPRIHREAIWDLICWMIHSMFVEMNVRRAPGTGMVVFGEDESDTKIRKCSIILRGTLAAHQFMAELIKADFIRHPIFASTMDEFLLTNKAAHATVELLVVKVKKLESEVKSAQAAADKAAGAARKGGGGGRGGGGNGQGGGGNGGGRGAN